MKQEYMIIKRKRIRVFIIFIMFVFIIIFFVQLQPTEIERTQKGFENCRQGVIDAYYNDKFDYQKIINDRIILTLIVDNHGPQMHAFIKEISCNKIHEAYQAIEINCDFYTRKRLDFEMTYIIPKKKNSCLIEKMLTIPDIRLSDTSFMECINSKTEINQLKELLNSFPFMRSKQFSNAEKEHICIELILNIMFLSKGVISSNFQYLLFQKTYYARDNILEIDINNISIPDYFLSISTKPVFNIWDGRNVKYIEDTLKKMANDISNANRNYFLTQLDNRLCKIEIQIKNNKIIKLDYDHINGQYIRVDMSFYY